MSGGRQAAAAATAAVAIDGRRVGTGVLVDGRHLLTAAHVLPGGSGTDEQLDEPLEVLFPTGPAPNRAAPESATEYSRTAR